MPSRDTLSRPLEVTTDMPQLPTLSIVSPTPRAFTFPITHNLAPVPNSPYSSPSHSPFELDLHNLVLSSSSSSSCTTPPPLPPLMPTLSPSSPSPHHKRRKSSSSSADLNERRPRKGDEDYIKRPENAFILFRRKCCEERQAALEEVSSSPTKKQRQADLSKTISQQWKSLTADERQYWEMLAKERKKEHEQKYPDYVYRPQRARDKEGRIKSRKPKRGDVDDSELENFTVGVPMGQNYRHHGRSASAPTPPPYQMIQIPNVYQMTPSCPTSPSLLPMISRRSSQVDYSEATFDYIQSDSFPFDQAGQLEASIQSSEFLRNMFGVAPTDSQQSMLLPLVSSASSISTTSSGPSSPDMSPFSPQSAMLLSRLTTSDPANVPTQADFDIEMEIQLQQEYAGYSWDTNSLWPTNSELLLNDDDFDLGSIPPLEVGIPKYQDMLNVHNELGYTSGRHHSHFVQEGQGAMDGIFAFDEIMGNRGF